MFGCKLLINPLSNFTTKSHCSNDFEKSFLKIICAILRILTVSYSNFKAISSPAIKDFSLLPPLPSAMLSATEVAALFN